MKPDLSTQMIQLWCVFFGEIADATLLQEYRLLLNAEERQQESRFRFAHDRQRYLVTRTLVRTVLSRYVPTVAPREWIFEPDCYSRPVIVNDHAAALKISFSITHTNDLVIMGVTRDRALGIDVENIRALPMSIELADRFLAPSEVKALYALPKYLWKERFFEYWTLKESYIKARGKGLTIPLDEFSFYFPRDGEIEISIHPNQTDLSSRWQFWQFYPACDYLAAVCVESSQFEIPHLVLNKVVPLLSEHEFYYEPLRAPKGMMQDVRVSPF